MKLGEKSSGDDSSLHDTISRSTGIDVDVVKGVRFEVHECCEEDVVGCDKDDDESRGQSILLDGTFQCQHADAVWGRRKGFYQIAGRDRERFG